MSEEPARIDETALQIRTLVDGANRTEDGHRAMAAETAASLSPRDIIALILGARHVRNRELGGDLFGEPAWDILLELYAAHHRGQAISVSAAVTFGDTPPTTGLRWLAHLENRGLVHRTRDSMDHRRQFVDLTADALLKIDQYAAAFGEWASARGALRRI